jgi:hypothetical protein
MERCVNVNSPLKLESRWLTASQAPRSVPTGMALTDLITDPTIMGMATPTTGPTGGPVLAFGSEPGPNQPLAKA